MIFRRTLLPLILFTCAGCSLIIGTLPEPDPLFKAAAGFGAHDQKTGCLIVHGQPDCSSSQQRVSEYLSTFLPSEPQNLAKSFKTIGFLCNKNKTTWECSYTKSQAPAVCAPAVRVSVTVTFPSVRKWITLKDLGVKTLTVPDPQNHDERGCFPL